ncbi:MAG: hypothetical protein ACJ0PP_03700 [Flavobacteriaceae bacterium]
MKQITTLTFFTFKKNKFWALQQIGMAPKKLKKPKGLEFFKFLGTGGDQGFSLIPDFSTYAFLGVWKNRKDFKKCINTHNVFLEYKEKANFQRDLELVSIKSHGLWDGKNPFINQDINFINTHKKKAVVLTRATINWNRLIQFWKSVPKASKAIEKACGVEYFKGVGEWPFIQQATISIWNNFDSVNNFAYKDKSHSDIVKTTHQEKWYKEDLFSRFYLLSDTTTNLDK